jgi:radical SAM superfamily enzyme YgiQ (UPF0313 family)
MKIVFVNPRYQEWVKSLPMGIAYLAAVASKAGYEISVIDANAEELTTEEVLKRINSVGSDIVAVSSVTAQIYRGWEILKALKGYRPEVTTVIGGVHPTSLPDESLAHHFIDFVVRGEAEETFPELLNALDKRKSWKDIAGISYRMDQRIVHNPLRSLIENLDRIPFPARHLFPFPRLYASPFMVRPRYATMITSRGCPGGCIFCNKNIFGFSFRMRSPENVVAEIEYLKNEFRIEEFHMADDCFSWDAERVKGICQLLLEKKLDIKWACSNGIRVDTVNPDLLKLMKKSGCYRISFGVESGSQDILKKIGKRISLKEIEEAFRMAQEAGMITVALFMLGNAGENRQTMEKTISFSNRILTDYAQFTIATPFPGTPFFRLVEKNGRFLSRDWAQFGVFSEPLFELDGLTRELMLRLYKQAYREFYFRPRQILFILYKRMRYLNMKDIWKLVGSFTEILKRMFRS